MQVMYGGPSHEGNVWRAQSCGQCLAGPDMRAMSGGPSHVGNVWWAQPCGPSLVGRSRAPVTLDFAAKREQPQYWSLRPTHHQSRDGKCMAIANERSAGVGCISRVKTSLCRTHTVCSLRDLDYYGASVCCLIHTDLASGYLCSSRKNYVT